MTGLLSRLSEQGTTIGAALIGAMPGSLGSVFLADWLVRDRQKDAERTELVQGHLTQLQESAEQLWFRIANASEEQAERRGHDNYTASVLYALGRYIATDRRIALEGMLPEITSTRQCSGLGEILKRQAYGDLFADSGLPYYDRLALVGFISKETGPGTEVINFYQFRVKYDALSDQQKDRYFARNLRFVDRLSAEENKAGINKKILQNLCNTINSTRRCIGGNTLVRNIKSSDAVCSAQ